MKGVFNGSIFWLVFNILFVCDNLYCWFYIDKRVLWCWVFVDVIVVFSWFCLRVDCGCGNDVNYLVFLVVKWWLIMVIVNC